MESETSLEKNQLREIFVSRRHGLSVEVCHVQSQEIARRLFASAYFLSSRTIHFYLAMTSEVQTDLMVAESLRRGKRVVVPVVQEKSERLTLSEWVSPQQCQRGPLGVLQPPPALQKVVLPEAVDLWIVPGIAFDLQGHRLGWGKGYYDRLLAGVRGRALDPRGAAPQVVGLAFDFQVIDGVPCEETDCGVDEIITEKRTIVCPKGEGERCRQNGLMEKGLPSAFVNR